MTADPLDRLREADPVPDGGSAPSFTTVMAKVRAAGVPAGEDSQRPERRQSSRRPRRIVSLRPALGIATSLAVVALVIVFALVGGGRSHQGTTAQRPTTTPQPLSPPSSLLPARGGMRGLLTTPSTFGSGPDLTAIFEQCPTCTKRLRGQLTAWQARSVDGGRRWQVERAGALQTTFEVEAQSGATVWALGSRGNKPTVFVSHDDGRHYTAVTAPATLPNESNLTIGDGRVWAIGNRCTGRQCHLVVLSGPVGGSRMTATAGQPAARPHINGVNASISAAGSSVYVTTVNSASGLQSFVSQDAGRSWAEITYPCTEPIETAVQTTGSRSPWAICLGQRPVPATNSGAPQAAPPEDFVMRSTDGGRAWTRTATLSQLEPTLDPVSDQVAWLTGASGTVKRTTDGGRTWRTVLDISSALDDRPQLVVQGAQTATIVVSARARGGGHHPRSGLVAYRTTDGGAHWTPTVIHLPAG